jgi:4-alpha-glucanotransferase
MTTTTTLLLGVHAHQPVGNFPNVIDEAHQRCYKPFLETLSRFPEFRFAAHFSGWLLDYLIDRFPKDMSLLQEMVVRGQVELFGSGECEPVLAAIPNRDRLGQLKNASRKIEEHFARSPCGAWLTERVWEASVVPALADSGIRYVVVDDYHFLCTGKTGSELDGYYSTEEDGRSLDLFPISEALRYRLPFSPATQTVAYLERLADAGQAAAIYFDDIEKFGIWPETYDWVYHRGWLRQFVRGVLRSPKIRTATYQEFHEANKTRGIVYLPTTSYIEMNEWTLPAPAAEQYAALMLQEKNAGRFERTKPFVRGGIWRNFFSRYGESNWMHKRMLQLSQRLADLPAAHRHPDMSTTLYRAQSNDAYWHGLFGGLYLPHLRRAMWSNLIALEEAIDAAAPRPPVVRADLDYDGRDELLLHNAHLQVALRLDGQGAPHEFDSYALRHNFGDTLRRTREHYHSRLTELKETQHAGSGIASAHDRVQFKHDIGPADLAVDARPRAILVDSWLTADGAHHELTNYELEQVAAPRYLLRCVAEAAGGRVRKHMTLDGAKLAVTWHCEYAGPHGGRFSTRLNLALPSCDGFGGRYILEDGSIPCGFGQQLVLPGLRQLTLDDSELGGSLVLSTSRPLALSAAPYHTVSLSEAGFEKIMQGVCLDLSWLLDASPCEMTLTLGVMLHR